MQLTDHTELFVNVQLDHIGIIISRYCCVQVAKTILLETAFVAGIDEFDGKETYKLTIALTSASAHESSCKFHCLCTPC